MKYIYSIVSTTIDSHAELNESSELETINKKASQGWELAFIDSRILFGTPSMFHYFRMTEEEFYQLNKGKSIEQ